AEAIGRELSAHVAPFDELWRLLIDSDIVLSALGSRRFTLEKQVVADALKARRSRPIFIVDAAVPGDVEPAVEELDDAFVYGLGDLERVALKGRAGREQEAAQAALVLDEEVEVFLNALAERGAVPVLIRMRSMFEEMRKQAITDSGGDAEKATRLLASRLLHEPSQALRKAAAEGADMDALAKLLEDLFPDDQKGGS
ncbi:MAG: glutamyl-tRNA reductase, partial [Rhodospirillaceae bacterium]|nr:glutamyl-tRNA reductase [Rhodospirillaceae bacterium]